MQVTIRRIEHIPVMFDYSIENISSIDKAVKRLLEDDESILDTRYKISVNTDAESTEIDEFDCWTVTVGSKTMTMEELMDEKVIDKSKDASC